MISAQISWKNFFFRKIFFSRTWSFFHHCKTTNLGLIFFHKKIILYFFQVWLFNFNTVLKTCFKNLFRKATATRSLQATLTLSFWWSHFSTWSKIQDKNLNILRRKRAFKVNAKVFFIIFKGVSVAENCLRLESAPLTLILKWTYPISFISSKKTLVAFSDSLIFIVLALSSS